MAKRKRPPLQRSQRPFWDRRTRLLALAMLSLAVAMFVWRTTKKPAGLASASPDEPDGPEQAQGSGSWRPSEGVHGSTPSSPGPSASGRNGPDPPPVIDAIELEKSEVCAGEENLVTVKAHTTNETNDYLHTVIDGHMGSSFPVQLWTDANGKVMGKHFVEVFARDNVKTIVPLPEYRVKDCRAQYLAAIQTRVRSNTWADFDIETRLVAVPPGPMTEAQARDLKRSGAPPPRPAPLWKPVSFGWDFGDGATDSTVVPLTEHNYEGRKQNALYSYFVIQVTMRGAKQGEVATGRTTLALINPAFEALAEKHAVQLLIALDPRFPELGPDGIVHQKVKIWHNQPGPVTITRAILTTYYKEAAGEAPPQPADATSVLGTTTIPPGADGITVTVTLDPESEPEVFSKTYNLEGKSEDGLPAYGAFSVMLPPAKPTADASTPITDPLLTKKIILARQVLGKDVVNDEDLWSLERQGAFASLTVSPDEAAAAKQAVAVNAAAGPKGPAPTYTPPGPAAPRSATEQLATPHQGVVVVQGQPGVKPGGK
jgi:hypothetical protein